MFGGQQWATNSVDDGLHAGLFGTPTDQPSQDTLQTTVNKKESLKKKKRRFVKKLKYEADIASRSSDADKQDDVKVKEGKKGLSNNDSKEKQPVKKRKSSENVSTVDDGSPTPKKKKSTSKAKENIVINKTTSISDNVVKSARTVRRNKNNRCKNKFKDATVPECNVSAGVKKVSPKSSKTKRRDASGSTVKHKPDKKTQSEMVTVKQTGSRTKVILTVSQDMDDTLEHKTKVKSKRKKLPTAPMKIEKLKNFMEQVESNVKHSQNSTISSTKEVTKLTKRSKLQSGTLGGKMKEKLNAARFRYLNEQLYCVTGEEALELIDEDSFQVYHQGFQSQVSRWPVNPLNQIISYVQKKPSSWVVADFGCGEAGLAKSVANKVHSFDLITANEHVTACDMSKVPLEADSVDIVVFCLSLMGTNLVDFLMEANRILHDSGILLVAEVKSRFEKIGKFVRKLDKLGFSLIKKDVSNTMFVWFEFRKTTSYENIGPLPHLELAPCLYKKR